MCVAHLVQVGGVVVSSQLRQVQRQLSHGVGAINKHFAVPCVADCDQVLDLCAATAASHQQPNGRNTKHGSVASDNPNESKQTDTRRTGNSTAGMLIT